MTHRDHRSALRRLGVCLVVVAVSALGAGDARPGGTAFPGKNGVIAFQSFRSGSSRIYIETVPPSPVRLLTAGTGCFAVPAWSPDGKRIAYEYNPNPKGMPAGKSDVYAMNANGTSRRPLTVTLGFDGDPAWSPDGKKIAFESTRSGNSDIWVMKADGTELHQLTKSPAFETAIRRGRPAGTASRSRANATGTRRST